MTKRREGCLEPSKAVVDSSTKIPDGGGVNPTPPKPLNTRQAIADFLRISRRHLTRIESRHPFPKEWIDHNWSTFRYTMLNNTITPDKVTDWLINRPHYRRREWKLHRATR